MQGSSTISSRSCRTSTASNCRRSRSVTSTPSTVSNRLTTSTRTPASSATSTSFSGTSTKSRTKSTSCRTRASDRQISSTRSASMCRSWSSTENCTTPTSRSRENCSRVTETWWRIGSIRAGGTYRRGIPCAGRSWVSSCSWKRRSCTG